MLRRWRWLVVVAVLAVVTLSTTLFSAESMRDALLFVCQDESAIERQIHKYIKSKSGTDGTMELVGNGGDDLILRYTIGGEGAPTMRLIVDTMISARDRNQKVTERCVKVFGFYTLTEQEQARLSDSRINEFNQQWMVDMWMPHRVLYEEKEHRIAFESYANIPGAEYPVHAEIVSDLLTRTDSAWRRYWKDLNERD